LLHAWLQDKGPITLGRLYLSLVGLIGLFGLLTSRELSSFVFLFHSGLRRRLVSGQTDRSDRLRRLGAGPAHGHLLAGEIFSLSAVHIWNAGVRFVAIVIVTQLIAQLGLALKLARMATLDPLTNLLNGRSFHEEGE
jgi:hypothetical protein